MRNVLLSTILLLLSANSMAESWQERGNYSIGWYDAKAERLVISTAEELAGLAYLVNNGYDDFEDKTLVLEADIDLQGREWIPIGHNDAHPFRGSIDGAGKYITGMAVVMSEQGGLGCLLGYIRNAEVKNINITGSSVTVTNTGLRVGGVAAQAEACRFSNCTADIDVSYLYGDTHTFDYEVAVGGMIGEATECSFSSCVHDGDINCQFGNLAGTSPEYYTKAHLSIGGVVGDGEDCRLEFCAHGAGVVTAGITESVNIASITYIGGIIGQTVRCDMMGCRNNAEEFVLEYRGGFNVRDFYSYIGGIAGYFIASYDGKGSITNCYSSTNVIGGRVWKGDLHLGGIVGSIDNDDEKCCKANFSPSDMDVKTENIKLNGYGTYDGSTAFSQADMKTTAFLNELNLLPIIENGKAIWTTTGGYPFVNQDNTPTTVKDAQTGKVSIKIAGRDLLLSKATDVRLFCIDGRQVYSGHTDRITGLPYGIYVLRIEGTTLKIALR